MVDWKDVAKTLGSTAVIVAVLGFVAQSTIEHYLSLDVEKHKSELKSNYDRQLEEFKTQLVSRSAQHERIRDEVVRWSNPILTAVSELEATLNNILYNEAYLALSENSKINPQWSIRPGYFVPSTVYLFSRYFCAIGLLEEKLSFELFEKHDVKDKFFERVRAVTRNLSEFPMPELNYIRDINDRQVFELQQSGMGEALVIPTGSDFRCMRYYEFLEKWPDPSFQRVLEPMTTFVKELQPKKERPWKRLQLMAAALGQLRDECRRLLSLEH